MRGLTLKRSQREKVPTWCEIEAVCAICKCSLEPFGNGVPGSQVTVNAMSCRVLDIFRRRQCPTSPFLSPPPTPVANIRQHFNRVCAFAWKSLKLNASDGNLYASLCLRIHGRAEGKFEGHRRWSGVSELGSVPKLICVGFSRNGTNFAGKGFGRCWPFCLFFFGRQHSSVGS